MKTGKWNYIPGKIGQIEEAEKLGVDFSKGYYAQSFGFELAEMAKKYKYRKPKNANGSTSRYYFYHLERIKRKK